MELHPIAFARIAARCGWRSTALSRYAARRGISDEARRRLWPRGVRSLALLVFHWLFDGTAGVARTRRLTRRAMQWLGL